MLNISRRPKQHTQKRTSLTNNNITNTIKKLLGQYTYVEKKKLPRNTINVIKNISNNSNRNNNNIVPVNTRPQNINNNKKVSVLTDELVQTCNKILLKKEDSCQCFDKNNYPVKDFDACRLKNNSNNKCEAYNKCRKILSSTQSGYEPHYNPNEWSDPLVEGTHNCYMYFLNDQKESLKNKCVNICKDKGKNNTVCKTKKQNSCSNLKPQPGNYAHLKGNFKGNRRIYSCPAMIDKVLKDNYKRGTKKSKIIYWDNLTPQQQFMKKCPDKHYKGVLVVHPKNTYHFYRQDKNGRYSHKQGTLSVENKDASKNPIYVPHLADMNYSKDDNSGINYTDFCGYMCIPENAHDDTYAD